jgi:hypothetical protein
MLAVVVAGCDGWQLGAMGASSGQELPTEDPVQEAVDWRRLVGLRSDEAYVQALAMDDAARARAKTSGLGFPVTEAEATEINRRISTMPQVGEVIAEYGEGLPGWGGIYADNGRGVVVASFTSDLETHRRNLAHLLHPAARWELRQVERSLSDLQALTDRVNADSAWFRTVDSFFTGAGPDQQANDVVVNVQSRVPDIGSIVVDHFDAQGLMRVVVSDRLPWTGPYGTVVIRAVDSDGDPVAGVYCWLVTDPAAWEEEHVVTGDEGMGAIRAGATDGVAQIRREQGDEWFVLGQEPIRIPANGTIEVRITVTTSP